MLICMERALTELHFDVFQDSITCSSSVQGELELGHSAKKPPKFSSILTLSWASNPFYTLKEWEMSRFDPHLSHSTFNLVFKTVFGFAISLAVAKLLKSWVPTLPDTPAKARFRKRSKFASRSRLPRHSRFSCHCYQALPPPFPDTLWKGHSCSARDKSCGILW